jgi:hypothetical protein
VVSVVPADTCYGSRGAEAEEGRHCGWWLVEVGWSVVGLSFVAWVRASVGADRAGGDVKRRESADELLQGVSFAFLPSRKTRSKAVEVTKLPTTDVQKGETKIRSWLNKGPQIRSNAQACYSTPNKTPQISPKIPKLAL